MAKKTKKSAKKSVTRTSKKKNVRKKNRQTVKKHGPISLSEARAAISSSKKKSTTKKKRRGTTTASPPVAAGTEVARARRTRLKEIRSERKKREKDFKKMMKLMKKRGVKGLTPAAPTARRRGTRAASGVPLQILAEGDSWFDYPVPFFGGGIIPRLEDLVGVPILNLAKAGDEVRNMLGVEERKVLIKQLSNGSPAGGKWDVLLFSGGGNDIVGDPMALWVRDFDKTVAPKKLINQPRFQVALDLVKAGYEDLIELRDSLSPDTHLVFHSYDFAIPDGRGVCWMGPWLKPTFDIRNFKTRAPAAAVVKEMLQQFSKMLKKLAKDHKDVTFINTQGTLKARTSSWHNELHPSKNDFDRFAKVFHKQLKNMYSDRIL